jgi:hypothetical protein
MKKPNLNKYRQTKEYFVSNQNYNYVVKDKDFKERVIRLRKKLTNDQEFGAAVSEILQETKNNDFPGIQKL